MHYDILASFKMVFVFCFYSGILVNMLRPILFRHLLISWFYLPIKILSIDGSNSAFCFFITRILLRPIIVGTYTIILSAAKKLSWAWPYIFSFFLRNYKRNNVGYTLIPNLLLLYECCGHQLDIKGENVGVLPNLNFIPCLKKRDLVFAPHTFQVRVCKRDWNQTNRRIQELKNKSFSHGC